MTLTLLLDRDDPRLTTRIDAFIAAYLELLGNLFSQRIAVKGDAIIHLLIAATRKMMHSYPRLKTITTGLLGTPFPACYLRSDQPG